MTVHRPQPSETGFTLLVVLVALSILAITLAVLLPVFSSVAESRNRLEDERTAIALARSSSTYSAARSR